MTHQIDQFNTRYLSPAEKVHVLAGWDARKREPRPDGDLGGRGYPDPEIFGLCNALNAIPGVCTLQSCAGHRLGPMNLQPGHLWLRLDETLSGRFRQTVFDLLRQPTIQGIATLYHFGDREIVEIVFDGTERGAACFERSVIEISAFFAGLWEGRP